MKWLDWRARTCSTRRKCRSCIASTAACSGVFCGDDPRPGKNYEHRKRWLEERLEFLAGQFGIDVLGFSILSNHFQIPYHLFCKSSYVAALLSVLSPCEI